MALRSGSESRSKRVRGGALLAAAAVAVVFGLAGSRSGAAPAAARPLSRARSIVLVVVDTLRADAGNPSAGPDAAIPEYLKSRGTHFDSAVAASDWTAPSVVSLLTGRYPSDCGLVSNDSVAQYPAAWTIASRLRARGYTTSAVVSNPMLSGVRLNVQSGFETFDDRMTGVERNRSVGTRSAPQTTEAALAALALMRSAGKPGFLWVQYLEPHGPYRAPSSYPRAAPEPGSPLPTAQGDTAGRGSLPRYQFQPDARGRNDYVTRYQSSASWALDETDRFLSTAAQKGYLRDTIVVFTSDHGEFLGEDDYWFQHGIHLNPAVVHVPLVVLRTADEPLSRESRPVSHLDFFPTMAGLVGFPAPADLPGQDLFARSVPRKTPILVENIAFPDSAEVGVVSNNRLVIKSTESAPESFQIGPDEWPQMTGEIPLEAVTTADGELKRVRKLPIPTRKVPPEEIQKLRALGYIR